MDWDKLRGSSIKKTDDRDTTYNKISKHVIYIVNKKLEKYYKKYLLQDNKYVQWEII